MSLITSFAAAVLAMTTAAAPAATTSATGVAAAASAGRVNCMAGALTVNNAGVLSVYASLGTDPLVESPNHPQLSFVPKAITYDGDASTRTGQDVWYATGANGYVWRVAISDGTPAKVTYKAVGTWGKTVSDITANGNRLYSVTTSGTLQRRYISPTTGALGSPTTLRTGLGAVKGLSMGGESDVATSTGTVVARRDLVWVVTGDGKLQQYRIRYAGTAGSAFTVTTVHGSGWARFDSVDIGFCTDLDNGAYLMARDAATGNLLTYVDRNVNTTSDGLQYTGAVGRIATRTYGI